MADFPFLAATPESQDYLDDMEAARDEALAVPARVSLAAAAEIGRFRTAADVQVERVRIAGDAPSLRAAADAQRATEAASVLEARITLLQTALVATAVQKIAVTDAALLALSATNGEWGLAASTFSLYLRAGGVWQLQRSLSDVAAQAAQTYAATPDLGTLRRGITDLRAALLVAQTRLARTAPVALGSTPTGAVTLGSTGQPGQRVVARLTHGAADVARIWVCVAADGVDRVEVVRTDYGAAVTSYNSGGAVPRPPEGFAWADAMSWPDAQLRPIVAGAEETVEVEVVAQGDGTGRLSVTVGGVRLVLGDASALPVLYAATVPYGDDTHVRAGVDVQPNTTAAGVALTGLTRLTLDQIASRTLAIATGPAVDRLTIGAGGAPPFASGWTNNGDGYGGMTATRTPGRVTLDGLIKNGASPGTITTLPLGWRPDATFILEVKTDSGVGRVDVSPSGVVRMDSGSTGFVSLTGATFPIA